MNFKSLFLLLTITPSLLQTKNFILVAAPGSGKGTFSQYVAKKYSYHHICPGDLFRKEIRNQTDFGQKIQPIVEAGLYIDEDIVCEIIESAIEPMLIQKTPFILDGFPRSERSLEFLTMLLKKHDALKDTIVMQLVASDAICLERMRGRLICLNCEIIYHEKFAQPMEENVCNKCKDQLAKRPADYEELAKNRLVYYHEHIEPIIKKIEPEITVLTISSELPIRSLKKEYDTLIHDRKIN